MGKMSEEQQFRGWDYWRLVIALVVFCLVAVWFWREVFWPSATTLTHGFGAYYSASHLLSNGELSADIYDPAYFLPIVQRDSQGQVGDIFNANPPTTTLLLWPLAFLPIEQVRLVWTVANVAFLTAGLGLLLSAFGLSIRERKDWPIWLLVLAVGLVFRPAIQNFWLGQAYVLIFFLLSITTAAFFKRQSTNRPRTSYHSAGGIALALALLLKTAGWPLLILLFWLRRKRFLAWVIGVCVFVMLVTLPIFPPAMWVAYGRLLSQVGRSPLVCVSAYQTTRSWLCHLFAPGVFWQEAETAGIGIPWPATVVYLALGAACLYVLLRLARKQSQTAFIGFICWNILFLPLGEVHHHTVMLIPFVWLMVRWSEQSHSSRILFILAAVCYLVSFTVNEGSSRSLWQMFLVYHYLVGAWLIFLGIRLLPK